MAVIALSHEIWVSVARSSFLLTDRTEERYLNTSLPRQSCITSCHLLELFQPNWKPILFFRPDDCLSWENVDLTDQTGCLVAGNFLCEIQVKRLRNVARSDVNVVCHSSRLHNKGKLMHCILIRNSTELHTVEGIVFFSIAWVARLTQTSLQKIGMMVVRKFHFICLSWECWVTVVEPHPLS